MKLQIRSSIFETNSSSMHAIVVAKDRPKEIYDGYMREFEVDEFGWEHRTYRDFRDKAAYLWTIIVNNSLKKVYEGTFYKSNWGGEEKEYEHYHLELDKDNEWYKSVKKAITEALIKVGIDEDRIIFQEEFEKTSYGSLEVGYVDHDPGKGFINEIVFNEDRLIRYLFNDTSMIETWNDNEWHLDPKVEEALEAEYWDPEEEIYKDGYWEADDWAHFKIPNEKDIEWKYLKSN